MNTAMIMEKKRILVVDDLTSDTKLLKRFLEGTNKYVVREENDAIAALAAAQEFQPHLILLDILMPDMDGAELASCLRANPKLQAVPIVFLTAKLSKKEADLCEGRIGDYPFLAKPIVLPEVAECLERLLK
jgi:CheY-like chemotaxis protein